MEYNYNQEIDRTVEELTTLYDENVYTNNNNEVNAVMVNDCFNTTAVAIGDLLKKIVNLDVKITAYYGLTIYEDGTDPDKSLIAPSENGHDGWLVRVDIPRLIDGLFFCSSGEYTMLHSILLRTSQLNNWNPDDSYLANPESYNSHNFYIYGDYYDNKRWSQGELWTYERELDMIWPAYEYTLMFFVEKQGNLALLPDLAISNRDDYYWEDGAAPVSAMTPYEYSTTTHTGGQIVQVDFKLKDLLTYLVE